MVSQPTAKYTLFQVSYNCAKKKIHLEILFNFKTGDNPCSLVGLSLNQPGEVAISLGTSDVLFGVTKEPKPNEIEGSILIHPLDSCHYMMMLVFKNGAMTRKFIKNSNFADDSDWSKFNEAIKTTSVGSNKKI